MKEPYAEGSAAHGDLESGAGRREATGEAMTEAHAGRVWSRENFSVQGADAVIPSGRQYTRARHASARAALRGRRPQACVEPPCARTGRSSDCPQMALRAATGRPEAVLR